MSFKRLRIRLQGHAKIFQCITAYGRKFLKCIVINLPSTKDDEINVFHSDVKIHVPYTGPHKKFLIYYRLCLKQHILNCVS